MIWKLNEHRCNHVSDPGACCPKAHNPSAQDCTCDVENSSTYEMQQASLSLALRYEHTKALRRYGVLPKHEIRGNDKLWVWCFLGDGGGPPNGEYCCICKEKIWY